MSAPLESYERVSIYDGAKLFLESAGKLSPEAKGMPVSSDSVRLRRELERRPSPDPPR